MSLPRSSRRQFITSAAAATMGIAAARNYASSNPGSGTSGVQSGELEPAEHGKEENELKISLAQWSLHRSLQGGKMDHLDFARMAREDFGIDGIEYVNSFFRDRAKDAEYLSEMDKRCRDHGVTSLLIMVDGEGNLGATDRKDRLKTVANHHRWADAAKTLGCHSIRVNAQSSGTFEEQQKLAADGLALLAQYCAALGLNVIVENHGGLSSNAKWLAGVMDLVDMPNCGTLPDFGNFWINRKDNEQYDRYLGMEELMPYAKAVSAKSYDFDDAGNETTMDFPRIMKTVYDAGYRGYVGIEYEGSRLDEKEGVVATRDLLRRCIAELTGG